MKTFQRAKLIASRYSVPALKILQKINGLFIFFMKNTNNTIFWHKRNLQFLYSICRLWESTHDVYFDLRNKGKEISLSSFLPITCLLLCIYSFNLGFTILPWAISRQTFCVEMRKALHRIGSGYGCFLLFI